MSVTKEKEVENTVVCVCRNKYYVTN